MVGVRGAVGGIDHVGAEVLRGDHVARQHGLAWIQRVQAARTVVGNNGHVRKSQPLTKAFVTAVQERFVFFDRTSQRAAKLVPLEGWDPLSSQSLTWGIEKVPGVQRAIAQKLEERTVQSIGAGLRDHADLRACPLAVFGRVGIGHHIEFPDGVNTQQLSADAPRRNADVAAAGVFNPIHQEEVVERPPASHSEIGSFPRAHRRPGFERRIVDGPGIESDQVIEAAAVKRQVLDLPLSHQSRNLRRGGVDQRGLSGDRNTLRLLANPESEVDHLVPAYRQRNSPSDLGLKARLLGLHFIVAEGQNGSDVTTPLVA